MSVALIENSMRLQAQRAMAGKSVCRYGIVTSYNPNNYSAKVTIQPEGMATGFIPVATPIAGNGWGMFVPPTAGDQVVVLFIDGDQTAGTVIANCYNSSRLPIQGTPQPQSGEFWFVHAKGQFLKITNDGKLTFSDAHGATFVTDGAGNIQSAANAWTHTGNFNVTGTIAATVDVTGGASNISLVTHTHLIDNVQVGGNILPTLPPTP